MGGWESSKLRTKSNGKWYYIYNSDNHELVNCKELIDYDKKYTPPNHKHFKADPPHVKCVGKMDNGNYRAPLHYQQPSLIAPIVYGSFPSHSDVRTSLRTSSDAIRQRQSTNSFTQTPLRHKTVIPQRRRSKTSMKSKPTTLFTVAKFGNDN